MRCICLSFALPLLAASMPAQQVCLDVNAGIGMPSTLALMSGPFWGLAKYTAASNLTNLTGMEVYLQATVTGAETNLGIWSVDAATGDPDMLLDSGPATVNPEKRHYHAALSGGISLTAGTEYYVGAQFGPSTTASGAQNIQMPNSSSGGTLGQFRIGDPATIGWISFGSNDKAIQYRLYCGNASGTSTQYGTGKPGTNALAPRLYLNGFPNVGNLVSLQVTDALDSAFAAVIAGDPVPGIPIAGLGTLYAFPIINALTGITSSINPGTIPATLTFDLQIPPTPSLAGATLGFQGLVFDPMAAGGLAHSDAIEFTLGN